mgnify:CR=1 FL=1
MSLNFENPIQLLCRQNVRSSIRRNPNALIRRIGRKDAPRIKNRFA